MIEHEIRTPLHNLLFCKLLLTEENQVVLELKNGKRVEHLPVETLLAEINSFTQGCVPELHIAVR